MYCRRPQNLAGAGHGAGIIDPLGQAEIGELGLALRVDQDVGGFQVPVDDALLMGILQVPGEVAGQTGGLLGGQRSVAQRSARLFPSMNAIVK